jgi:hypothetical protein
MLRNFALIVLVLFALIACTEQKEVAKDTQQGMDQVTGNYAEELQKTACDSADGANTCDSKLASLGFITKEECCTKFKKCC